MKLLAEIRIASADARNTIYVPVVVDAKDGGDAQRKALEIAQAAYPNNTVSGGTVYPPGTGRAGNGCLRADRP